MKNFSNNGNVHPRWTRKLVYLQIAVQAGIALTPFYAITVQAAVNPTQSDDRLLSGSAQHVSGIGQAAQTGNLNGFAAQQASGLATQEIQQWLQNFGTARVELGTDDRFQPHDGAVDVLIPLYKSEDRLLFTQNGIRNKDGQFTGNFGLGQRHFTGDWMLGYNAFYDQNFSQGHKRVGSGLEAWRDYLKLSGNGYYRLSDWRNSGDVEDYDARPANGFDLRAEGWLPAYPALGGRLMYEKYYGDEVALFGKDKRQKNPAAVTAGLSYTPVPLISLTADHKRGGDQSDTSFGLQLSYQFGQPLSSQLDPAGVGQKRTLAGSGMDLVERNNNIVLEYRKQELIKLALPQVITGESGRTVPISYQLTSKYGLSKIVWNDAAIVAGGGQVQDLGGGKYQLVLPSYLAGTANSWPLSGVAYDTRNNISGLSSTTVTVTRPGVSAGNSTVTSALDTILANGTATTVITVTLGDEDGQPVTGLAADLKASVKEEQANVPMAKAKAAQAPAQPATLSAVTEQGAGVYTLTLTSGTRPMLAVVSPALGDLALNSVAVHQISDADSATVRDGSLTLLTDGAVANLTATNQIQARVTDATGNPVANVEVIFSLGGSAQVAAGSNLTALSDQNGYVSVLFTNTVAETVTVTAQTANGGSAKADAVFVADKSTAALAENDLTVDRVSAVANGKDSVTFSALVKDANGNPTPDVSVNWTTDGGQLSGQASSTGADGRAIIGLSNTVAQSVLVQASVNGSSAVNAPGVSFSADSGNLDASKSALSASEPTIVANGSASSVITLSLKDANNNPVSGQAVTFNTTLGGSMLGSVTDHGDGTYSAALSGTTAGNESITASIGGNAFGAAASVVTMTADSSNLDAGKSALSASQTTLVADGAASSVITFSLKDVNNNPVSGLDVTFNKTLSGSAFGNVTDNNDGTYSAALTGTLAGNESITANVAGAAFGAAATAVTLTADSGNLDAGKSALSASQTTIVADGAASSVITFSLKDVNNNPVSGLDVTFNKTLGGTAFGTVTDHNDGTYSAVLTGTTAGTESITASIAGTAFGTAATAVTLTADSGNLDAGKSALSASESTLVADGTASSVITLSLKDANNNPVSGLAVTFNKTLSGSAFGNVTDNNDGTYSAALTGTTAGNESITANVAGTAFGAAATVITMTADSGNLDAGKSALNASETTIIANGTSASVITLSLKDVNNNPVNGLEVTFNKALNGSIFSDVTDHGDGTYSAELTGTTAGNESITASIAGTAFGAAATAVTLTADSGNLDAGKSALSASQTTIVADGTAPSVITLSLKDVNNNPVSGLDVTFNKTLNGSTFGSVTDHNDGTYSAELSGTMAGSESITASIAGTAFGAATTSVTLTADSGNLDAGKSALSASESTIVADGAAPSVITLSLKDVNNNPVSGLTVTFNKTLSGSAFGNVTDNNDGTYSAALTGTLAGNESITANVAGAAFGAAATAVTLTADSGNLDAGKSALSASQTAIVADGTASSVITLSLKDVNNNPVSGLDVTFNKTLAESVLGNVTDNGDGTYSATLSGTKSGNESITANIAGAAFGATAVAVTLTGDSGNLDTDKSALSASEATITADGVMESVVTLSLKDANDNPVSGLDVTFNKTLSGTTFGTVTDHNDGTYSAVMTGTTAGSESITASIAGVAFGAAATPVALTADSTTATIGAGDISVSKGSIVANDTDTSLVKATVKDAHGNILSGITVTWTTDHGTVDGATSVTDSNGEATTELKALLTGATTPDGSAIVSAQPGSATAVNAPTVVLVVPAQKYAGPRITFTGSDPAKEGSFVVTGRTGKVTDTVSVAVRSSKADKSQLQYALIAPDGTSYPIKNAGAAYQEVTEINVAGKSKVGTWKLRMDDFQAGSTSYTMDWDVTL